MASKVVLADMDRDIGQMGGRMFIDALVEGIVGRDAGAIIADVKRADSYTEDGSFLNPYKTLAAAVAALTIARPNILLMPGQYDVTVECALPEFSCCISGVGGKGMVRIEGPPAVDEGIFRIAPTRLDSTAVFTFKDLMIEHGDQIGIQIDNTQAVGALESPGAKKKIVLIMEHVEMGGDEAAIDVDHDLGSEGVCLYIEDSYIEGKINFDVGNDDDRLYFKNCQLDGVLDTTGDNTTVKVRAWCCMVPHGAWATNGTSTSQVIICMGCFAYTNKTTIEALDTDEIGAGSLFTETILP